MFEVRAYINGNIHMRMHQRLALALNVEYGRIRGWLKTPKEAQEELDEPAALEFFHSYAPLAIGGNTFALLK